jgi:hypothetical protein
MRRKGTSPSYYNRGYGTFAPHSTPGSQQQEVHDPRVSKFSLVPKEWTEHATQPWRILFPDLDWTPPERDL